MSNNQPRYVPGQWSQELPTRFVLDRDSEIVAKCIKKRVLHIGASDWPFTRAKGSNGLLLHQRIEGVAAELVGVDIDEEAISELSHFTKSKLYRLDATTDVMPESGKWDVVVCGDVIEHVEDIGGLVRTCRSALADGGVLCLSTINATALKPAIRAMGRREAVHHDHVAYFSYSTLCNLMVRNKMVPVSTSYFGYPTRTRAARVSFNMLFRACPSTSDGIILFSRKDDLFSR